MFPAPPQAPALEAELFPESDIRLEPEAAGVGRRAFVVEWQLDAGEPVRG